MIYREIVHTCSNSKVAGAAIDSIGGDFALAFKAEAARHALSPGALGAYCVREFASNADEVALQNVTAVADGSDVPVLTGLRYILERVVQSHREPTEGRMPAWMIAATQG